MKFVERKTGYPERYLKIFGLKIFWWKYSKEEDTYYTKVLYGLISSVVVNDYRSCTSFKVIKILNIPVLRRVDDGETRYLYLFNKILLKKTKNSDLVKKRYKDWFSGEYDGLIVLICNSGEPYLFLKHIFYPFIKKEGIKKPLIVCTRKYHTYLVEAVCPEIPHVFAAFPRYYFLKSPYVIDNIIFFVVMHPLHFNYLDNAITNGRNIHYFDAMLRHTGVMRKDITNVECRVSDKDKNSMLDKVSKAGLNLENFVFISPESLSCRNNDSAFWCSVIKYYQNKGFDIYVNIVQNQLDLSAVEFKSCFLTFPEALELAKLSKKIIGSRSGFLEFLSQTGVDMEVIYAPFYSVAGEIFLTAEQVMTAYTMKKIPFIKSKVSEYYKKEFLEIVEN